MCLACTSQSAFKCLIYGPLSNLDARCLSLWVIQRGDKRNLFVISRYTAVTSNAQKSVLIVVQQHTGIYLIGLCRSLFFSLSHQRCPLGYEVCLFVTSCPYLWTYRNIFQVSSGAQECFLRLGKAVVFLLCNSFTE